MSSEPLAVLLSLLRVTGYAGFVLWAGPLVFWSLVWPDGHRHRQLFRLAMAGAAMLLATSVAEPVLRLSAGQPLSEVAPPLVGAAALVRLAVLVGSLFFLVDLLGAAVLGRRRVLALGAVVVVAATMAIQPAVAGQPGPALAAVGIGGHLLATAAWLGGLVALAVVVAPGRSPGGTDLIGRFSPIATTGLAVLVLAGGVSALAAAGGLRVLDDRRELTLLLAKLGLLVALLLLARYAHRATTRLAFRRLYSPVGPVGSTRPKGPTRDRTLALVVGAELAIAFAALSATVLVGLAA
jgi:putative copper export protein